MTRTHSNPMHASKRWRTSECWWTNVSPTDRWQNPMSARNQTLTD